MSFRWTIVRRLPLIFLLGCLCAGTSAPLWAADSPPSQRSQRTVHFAIRDQERSSLSSAEPRLPLTIELSRESNDPEQIFLRPEGAVGGHIWVPMATSPTSGAWQATVVLDPVQYRQTANKPQAFRIDVSFARVQGMKLSRFLKRTVYITTGIGDDICSVDQPEKRGARTVWEGFLVPGEVQAASPAVREESVTETQLAGPSVPVGGSAYWGGIQQRIAERWKHYYKRRGLTFQVKTAPRIHFRLYANGTAQTVYLERSSGYPRVDDAALASVIETQPFPAFPSGVGRCYMDVRVDLPSSKRR